MMPTMRDDTVTKKKPKTTMNSPRTSLLTMAVPGMKGRSAMITMSADAAADAPR